MNLLVGCPINRRSWVLPHWFEALRVASEHADVSPGCLFVVGNDDRLTLAAIAESPFPTTVVKIDEPKKNDTRIWGVGGDAPYRRMSELRNDLLWKARALNPDVFLSLDSDLLLHPDALVMGLESMERFDAVGLGCYMTPLNVKGRVHGSTDFPSTGRMIGNRFYRERMDDPGVYPADVIMAAKLMSPAAYHVDYPDKGLQYGEDIAWSSACRGSGLKLGWDNRTISRHVLSPIELHYPDPRIYPEVYEPWHLSRMDKQRV